MPFLDQVVLSLIYARSGLKAVKVAATGLNKIIHLNLSKHTYKCLRVSCPYELRIVRILGGLVLLEKQKIENGVTVLVVHDKGAGDYVPSLSKCVFINVYGGT